MLCGGHIEGGENGIQELTVQVPTVPWTQRALQNTRGLLFLEHPYSPPLSSRVSRVQMSPPLS